MSEDRFYELGVPKFEGEEGKEEQTQSIPPISTFAKRTGNASGKCLKRLICLIFYSSYAFESFY